MAWRKMPSAIGLRHTLPVQTKRIVFIHPCINPLNLGRLGYLVNREIRIATPAPAPAPATNPAPAREPGPAPLAFPARARAATSCPSRSRPPAVPALALLR